MVMEQSLRRSCDGGMLDLHCTDDDETNLRRLYGIGEPQPSSLLRRR